MRGAELLLISILLALAPSAAPAREKKEGYRSGTGFFVSDEGYLVTNAHVVAECTVVMVKTEDGKMREAARTATDTTNDLALLKLDMGWHGSGQDVAERDASADQAARRETSRDAGRDLGGEIGGVVGGRIAGEIGGDIGGDPPGVVGKLRTPRKDQPEREPPKQAMPKDAAGNKAPNTDPSSKQASTWRVVPLRLGARLGEGVEAFGFPHTDILSSAGNFTLGNVTALAGIGDDPRYLQISAPVQAGNSGGPLLDGSGNLVGIVSMKLNAVKVAAATHDFMQNVNFAVKSSVLATFLDDNRVAYKTGALGKALEPADIADQARAMSGFVICR